MGARDILQECIQVQRLHCSGGNWVFYVPFIWPTEAQNLTRIFQMIEELQGCNSGSINEHFQTEGLHALKLNFPTNIKQEGTDDMPYVLFMAQD